MDNERFCNHKWYSIDKVIGDSHHWLTIMRCRRCNLLQQERITVEMLDGKMMAYSTVMPVPMTDYSKTSSQELMNQGVDKSTSFSSLIDNQQENSP